MTIQDNGKICANNQTSRTIIPIILNQPTSSDQRPTAIKDPPKSPTIPSPPTTHKINARPIQRLFSRLSRAAPLCLYTQGLRLTCAHRPEHSEQEKKRDSRLIPGRTWPPGSSRRESPPLPSALVHGSIVCVDTRPLSSQDRPRELGRSAP